MEFNFRLLETSHHQLLYILTALVALGVSLFANTHLVRTLIITIIINISCLFNFVVVFVNKFHGFTVWTCQINLIFTSFILFFLILLFGYFYTFYLGYI